MILASSRQRVLKKLALCLSVSILSFPIASGSSNAQMGIPSFEPTSGWAVNQTLLAQNHGLKDVKLPCMMATEYDNGYIVRLAGGGNKLMALAVDFRQQVFQQGRQYEAQIDLDGAYNQAVVATAFSESILLFNIRTTQGLYDKVKGANNMTLYVEDNGFKFSLSGVKSGLNSLESCYSGKMDDIEAPQMANVNKIPLDNSRSYPQPLGQSADTLPTPDGADSIIASTANMNLDGGASDLPASQPRRQKSGMGKAISDGMMIDGEVVGGPSKMTAITPSTVSGRPELSTNRWQNKVSRPLDAPDYRGAATDVTPNADLDMMVSDATDEVLATPRVSAPIKTATREVKPNNIWQAAAGDSVRGTLERWANVAGVEIDWQANQAGGVIANSFEYNGQFETAVQTLMAENAAVMGLQAEMQMMSAGGYKPSNVGTMPKQSAYRAGASAAPSYANKGVKWSANQGDSLERVLTEWARKENVELIWQSNQNFNVMRGVNSNSSFEIALQALLGQYTSEVMRPAAQLNIDPSTGIRMLIVDSTGVN